MAVGIHSEIHDDELVLSAMFEGKRSEKKGSYLNSDELCVSVKKEIFRG